MARKAPPISVKDLTAALAIGKQQGKEESLVAADPLPADDPFAPARPNPNAPPSSPWLPGKSPAPSRPSLAHGGPHYNEYGQTIPDPTFGIDPGGGPVRLDHMEQSPEEKIENEKTHERNFPHPSHELKISQTRRDKAIRNIINTYGKDGQGNYKDPSKLLSNLLTIAEA